jgi:hypothetical protein
MGAASRRPFVVFVLAAAVFGTVAALSRLRAALPADGADPVRAIRIELPDGDPARSPLGALVFRGGIVLESADARFGGLSDLRLSPDGTRMVAVSDCGYGFVTRLVYDRDDVLVDVAEPRIVELTGPGGGALRVGENDAESLVADGPHLDVGFEGRARVWRYAAEPPFGPPVVPQGAPPGLAACGPNSGLETMAPVDATRRLLVCEGGARPSLTVPAWIGSGDVWVERPYPLHFEGGWAGEPFRPTSGARLPDGDLLVVERRFPPVGIRLVRLSRASLDATGNLAPSEVASLGASSLADNYEGIDARRDTRGRTLVYLLSDDNGCAKPGGSPAATSRTRLVVFELVG